jgi:hypothetical protein
MVGKKPAARFTSRMSDERSADELHPRKMERVDGIASRSGVKYALQISIFFCGAEKWRNAVDLRHTPVSRSALFSRQARHACPVDIPNWSAWQDSHLQPFRLERNASADWATRGVLAHGQNCSRSDLH